jgi:hypothetical protein
MKSNNLRTRRPVARSLVSIILFSVLLLIGTYGCSSSVGDIEVSDESQHRTKVWLLERYQQIEHPLLSELFQRSLERLEPGVQSIASQDKRTKEPRLYVISSDEITAFSLCDGSIFVTSKMIELTPSSEVFMAIIAHEISHVIHQHACWTSEDKSAELTKEIKADSDAARILYVSYINPHATLQALSLYYRKFINADAKKFIITLDERKKSLSRELQQYPPISSRMPEERLFRKVRHLVSGFTKSSRNR